mmetsp:Transcript_15612/g.34111  ORF Transcript_15612/g.34111 Transcript_15612/m.34111 type:complete len:126 (+) Transcript_15612:193-570(+)|eukprot:CAMPEP_0168748668 /NCGR_PEP_ID=MMETSP0724-20121128/16296_1 /TAXON_ID=265536 /ORGANISM="Amphiprora sp., Strain CCMP467" /LENGTH=125 /DNA_ID=CAMNT_0008796507 /DNA_START=103 /DNA_END=480 /DNA_ORIENTATION=+
MVNCDELMRVEWANYDIEIWISAGMVDLACFSANVIGARMLSSSVQSSRGGQVGSKRSLTWAEATTAASLAVKWDPPHEMVKELIVGYSGFDLGNLGTLGNAGNEGRHNNDIATSSFLYVVDASK